MNGLRPEIFLQKFVTTQTHILKRLGYFASLDAKNTLCQLFQLSNSTLSRLENCRFRACYL